MPEKKKRKSFGYWFGHEWRGYVDDCRLEFKGSWSFTKYLFLLPKLLGQTIVHFVFLSMIIAAFVLRIGIEENDQKVD